MINLAGRKDATDTVLRELQRCGIETFVDPMYTHPEVKTSVRGTLHTVYGQFTFSRNWYYWDVEGRVPLALALKLYADPVGKTDIRVAGHCLCPPPEAPWVDWFTPDGKKVLSQESQKEFKEFAESPSDFNASIGREGLLNYVFSDDPASIGAQGFVTTYHIDTELGLYLFARLLKDKIL